MSLKNLIKSDKFIVTAELGPPQSANRGVIERKAGYFKGFVHAVNITDNQTAIVRFSSIAAAKILIDSGLEPVIQMTCRDRNRIAIQSDLLGAFGLGIENVLCLTGDYTTSGTQPEARPVYDMDSIQLIASVSRMNRGTLLSGDPIKTPTGFCIGGAANPFAPPFEMRIIRLQKKIAAGAQFIQTQPVFDLEIFKKWMERVNGLGLSKKTAILAGVMPVKSVKALEYMKSQVPGMRIHPSFIKRMAESEDPKAEGVNIAVELIEQIREIPGIRGIHLMPLMWESITPEIIKKSGITIDK
ncbi:methylenetetrahydrofolate reductase [candidate division KSB1 bacterium]|nr:MAG: methylenetetrahydrofolate reductase [candidate division KSB1 bacterium]